MSISRPSDVRQPFAYTDRLLRPFLVAAFVAIVAAQLAESRAAAAPLGWIFFVPVALASLWTLLPTRFTPKFVQTMVLCVYAVLAGILFALPADTFSAGFVFLASLAAGQILESHRVAVAVALLAAMACAGASLLADQTTPESWPWWLGLTAGLPVYIGIARRERADALAAARRAATESERARASEAREAALIERGRIAGEIHDVLGHSLSAISIQLDMADALFARGRSDESIKAVRRAHMLAKSGIGETRRAVHALHEDTKPLTESIRAISSSSGASFTTAGRPGTLRIETTQTLVRAAQETLTNAHRHAPGAAVTTTLTFTSDDSGAAFVELTVDNGPTFGVVRDSPEEGTGMGLQGMRERAELLGGTVSAGPVGSATGAVEQGTGRGWCVTIRLPQ